MLSMRGIPLLPSLMDKIIVKFELLKNACAFCACVQSAIIEEFRNDRLEEKQKSRTKRTCFITYCELAKCQAPFAHARFLSSERRDRGFSRN